MTNEKIVIVALANALRANDAILHAPQTLEVIGEEFKEGRPQIILAKEESWWRRKK